MKYLALLAGVASAVGVATGCGGDEHPGVVDTTGNQSAVGGKTSRGGTSGGGKTSKPTGGEDAGGAGGEAANGLDIAVTSPAAASDPSTDEVLVDDKVTVVCTASALEGGSRVDSSTVVLDVLGADGEVVEGQDKKPLSLPGVPTGTTDEYSAAFVLNAVDTGVVSFRCSATSVDKMTMGKATISTFVDHGPTIVETLPQKDSAHPLEGVLSVDFTVTPTPLADGDQSADVANVTLQVAGVPIKNLTEDAKNPGTYHANVDFTDPELFKEPPKEHTSVHIEATNGRTPKAATAVDDYPIVVDGKGPAIAYTRPKDNAAVHGETVIGFTAADTGAGLNVDTLEIGVSGLGDTVKYDVKKTGIWSRDADNFTFRFDTGILTGIKSQITVSIRAEDLAGNLTDGVTLLIYEDDLPPAIDLDPGNARGRDSLKVCSESFDPLFDALNDGVTTSVRNNLFRALVYDQTNSGTGQDVLYFAGTDRTSVNLYIQPDSSQPFLIDTNKDGICDSLAREDFKYESLRAVPKAGGLQYSDTDAATLPLIDKCILKPSGPRIAPLCNSDHGPTVIIQHDIETGGDEPVVYGVGSLMGAECTGAKFDLHDFTTKGAASLSPDGWICLAVRGSDHLGNIGISRPLRICYDDPDVAGVPACVGGGTPPPSCTTDCTAPPRFPAHIYRF